RPRREAIMSRATLLVVAVFVTLFGELDLARASYDRRLTRDYMRQIVVGMQTHMDANGTWPTDIRDAQGKQLLSWRVRLLPVIEEDNLYKQFRLNESWDSPHNRQLIEKMPRSYASLMSRFQDRQKGLTTFLQPRGPGTLLARELWKAKPPAAWAALI